MRAPSPNPNDNPFPGLRPFREEEEHYFFGRENQVDAMVDKLAATHFLAVVGTSGSGKSSLVNCGLRPALRRGLMARAGTAWRMAQFRPGTNPISAMARELAENGVLFRDHAPEGLTLTQLVEVNLRMSKLGLIDIFEQAKPGEGVNLLVVVDQFEELFRYRQLATSDADKARANEEATAFVNLLLEIRERMPERIFVVLTMRSDFLGDCTQFPGLAEAINAGQYLVPRLTRDERRAAIEGPVRVAGADISPVLLTRLVNDVGDIPDQLSVLQHALNRTWAYWKKLGGEGPIDFVHYETVGTMERALDQHAERAYGELADERQKLICEKMFKALTDKANDPRGVRRPTRVGTICTLADATAAEITTVINVFRKKSRSFLVPPLGDDPEPALAPDTVVDISHESLMRVWKQLNMWADEEARSAGVYRRLADTAAEFSDDEEGLYRGPQLQIALAWRERDKPNETWAARYHPGFAEAMAFLDKSRAKRDADLAKEKRRSERELRKARVVAGGMALFSLVAAAAGSFALWALLDSKESRVRENSAKVETQRSLLKVEITRARLFALLSQTDPADRTKVALLALETLPDPNNPDPNVARRLSYDMQDSLVEAIKKEHEYTFVSGHTQGITSVAVTSDGRRIVSGSNDKTLRIWDANSGRQLSKLDFDSPVRIVAITPDSQHVVVSVADRAAKVLSAATLVKEHDLPMEGRVFALAIMPDGKRVVTGASDGNLRVWDIDTGTMLREWKAHDKVIFSLAVTPDGEIVSASGDTRVRIWNAETGELLRELEGHTQPVLGVVISPDGSQIVTRSSDRTVRTWDARTGEKRLQLRSSDYTPAQALSIAVAAEPQRLLIGWSDVIARDGAVRDHSVRTVGLDDETLRKWKTGVDVEMHDMQLKAHEGGVTALAVTPDGKRIITGSVDRTIRVWTFDNSYTPPSKLTTKELRQDLIDLGKMAVPRCLTTDQRWELALGLKPPDWCIDREKYPYNTQDWKDWQARKPGLKSKLADTFANHADWALKLKGDIGVALEAAEMSIQFNPSLVWTRINLAHAQMFLGYTEAARKEYLSHCGTVLPEITDSPVWEDAVLKDFSSLRSKDRYDPLMDEIAKRLEDHDCLPNVDKASTEKKSAKVQ